MLSTLTMVLIALGQCSGGSCGGSYGGYGGYGGYSGYGWGYGYPTASYAAYVPSYAAYTPSYASYAAPTVTYAATPAYAQTTYQAAYTTAAQPAPAPVPTAAKSDAALERIAKTLDEINDKLGRMEERGIYLAGRVTSSPEERREVGVRKPKIRLDW